MQATYYADNVMNKHKLSVIINSKQL